MDHETQDGKPNIFPGFRYTNAPEAMAWLGRAFGFEEHFVVPGPDGSIAHAQLKLGAGAEIVRELNETEYGSREYSACDPEGNVWSFGTYQPLGEEP